MKMGTRNFKVSIVAFLVLVCVIAMIGNNVAKADGGASKNEGYNVNVTVNNSSLQVGDTISLVAKVTYNGKEITNLEENGLSLWWWADQWMTGQEDGLLDVDFSYSNGSANSLQVDATLKSIGNYYIAVTLQDASGTELYKNTVASLETKGENNEPIKAPITVEKIPNLREDFMMGMDISSVISEFESEVIYKDFDGNTINNIEDFCKFLKEECGITHVRVRVWNNPYDASGNGYGGGNNDVQTAVEIAKGCAKAGVKMLIDFHYSDFWADPKKKQAPKEWKYYTVSQKEVAIKEFTKDALEQIRATGADVDMVQIGNETIYGFVGETEHTAMCQLFQAGAKAVREIDSSIQVVIHVTNPEKSMMTTWAKILFDNGVDYDVLATSYYPSSHGTFENLQNEMKQVKDNYGKEVMVAETSYSYTTEDSDGHSNGTNVMQGYPISVQGQASFLRDFIKVINEAGGIGLFYWEPAWITVGDTTNLTGDDFTKQLEQNRQLWEVHGSGWASKYSEEYDPEDAGKWYGGSSMDSQAMFYPNGMPTESIKVWSYVRTGAISDEVSVEEIEGVQKTIQYGETCVLPEQISVIYSQGNMLEQVIWNKEDLQAIDSKKAGEYKVNGVVSFSKEVTSGEYANKTEAEVVATITVLPLNYISDLEDAGFEKGDNFTVIGDGVKEIPSKEDVLEGNGTLHWYSQTAQTATITYDKLIALEKGTYNFEAIVMGSTSDKILLQILDKDGKVLAKGKEVALGGWTLNASECKTPSVTFQLENPTSIKLQVVIFIEAEGWGSADRLTLTKQEQTDVDDEIQDSEKEETTDTAEEDSKKEETTSTAEEDSKKEETTGTAEEDNKKEETTGTAEEDSKKEETTGVAEEDSKKEETTDTTKEDIKDSGENVAEGDNTNVVVWIGTLISALIGILALVFVRKENMK